jgi:hypothetical protein
MLLTPWDRLATIEAVPDTFEIAMLGHFGTHPATVVGVIAIALLAASVALPRRFLLLFPALVLTVLVLASAVAAHDIAPRVAYDQRNLVGIPPDWIKRATKAPAAYFYDGESYWNGVWQVRFWNPNVTDVVAEAPSRVPGPMPQRRIIISRDGRLPIRERYIVASDAHSFNGTPVAHLTQFGLEVDGLTLWRLDGPARLVTVRRGIRPDGDMTEPGIVRAYDCAGGHLELTLLPKATTVVTLQLDGNVIQRARIGGLEYWNGTIDVPPSPSPHVCRFEIDGQSLLGSTRIVFVHR